MNWTEEEYQDFLQSRKTRHPIKFGKPKAKYYAKKVEKYGRLWDSKKELREYEKLLDLKESGEIKRIELQPKFELQPAFRYQGKAQRLCQSCLDKFTKRYWDWDAYRKQGYTRRPTCSAQLIFTVGTAEKGRRR